MSNTTQRTIKLDSNSLEAAIQVLASAAASFSLNRRERNAYRALMLSVNLAMFSLFVVLLMLGALVVGDADWAYMLLGFAAMAFVACGLGGALALVLSLPLLQRMWRERARLKRLGVTRLSESLWKASRRRDWFGRLRGAVIVVCGVFVAVLAMTYFVLQSVVKDAALLGAFFLLVAAVLFGARHLRKQREQMDLAANAADLQRALQSLRAQAAPTQSIEVPIELVERAANIESAQIARDRRDAIVTGAGTTARGYAITFDEAAAAQRAGLDMSDRLALEDMLADLSVTGTLRDAASAAPSSDPAGATPAAVRSDRIEVSYSLDRAAQVIRIHAVAGVAGRQPAGSANG